MSGKARTGVNVGSSSILVIFVLLCLTTFATLSMVSANADYNLTRKAASSTRLYYQADSRAEERLQEVDETLASAALLAGSRDEYFVMVMDHLSNLGEYDIAWESAALLVSYQAPIDENQALRVSLEVTYPPAGESRYTVKEWRSVSLRDWEVDSGGPELWDGEDFGGMLATWEE